MNSSQKGGKTKSTQSSKSSKSSKSSTSSKITQSTKSTKGSKTKKGGNFLGSVSDLFVPVGWENFATAAGLFAIDRADAAFRRSRNSNKKQKGGADMDGHETLENMEHMMEGLEAEGSESEMSTPQQMNGGGRKTTKKSGTKKTSTKKTTAKKTTKKGGNFLGAVGELVAPAGWESFATAAGLLAIDRADAALRRGTKEKKQSSKK
jgi:hypothetical protein